MLYNSFGLVIPDTFRPIGPLGWGLWGQKTPPTPFSIFRLELMLPSQYQYISYKMWKNNKNRKQKHTHKRRVRGLGHLFRFSGEAKGWNIERKRKEEEKWKLEMKQWRWWTLRTYSNRAKPSISSLIVSRIASSIPLASKRFFIFSLFLLLSQKPNTECTHCCILRKDSILRRFSLMGMAWFGRRWHPLLHLLKLTGMPCVWGNKFLSFLLIFNTKQ